MLNGYVFSEPTGEKPVGKVTTVSGSQGLGLLRLTALTAPLVVRAESMEIPIREVEILDSHRVGGPLTKGISP